MAKMDGGKDNTFILYRYVRYRKIHIHSPATGCQNVVAWGGRVKNCDLITGRMIQNAGKRKKLAKLSPKNTKWEH